MPELALLIVMELEANEVPHEMIYVDEAGFNLAKRCWGGKNIIGIRATVTVPGQRGANYIDNVDVKRFILVTIALRKVV